MTPDYLKLIKYVNCASELAESLQGDIKRGEKVTSNTVVKLSKFIAAAQAIQNLLDQVQVDTIKLN